MIKTKRSMVAALALSALVAGAFGCKKEGPAERAGKSIDQAGEKAGHEMEKAGDKLKDTVNDMKK